MINKYHLLDNTDTFKAMMFAGDLVPLMLILINEEIRNMKRFIQICMIVGIAMFLSACGETDAMLMNIKKEVDNETYKFSTVRYIEVLSDCSSNNEVAEEFIQIIKELKEENKTEGIEELLHTFEKQEYKNPQVAECVAELFWDNKDAIMQLIKDDSYDGLLSLDYYGPVSGIKKVDSDQIKGLIEHMTLLDKIEFWKQIKDSLHINAWKDMIPFTAEEVSEYTSGMTLDEKLDFAKELPRELELPDLITAEDVNSYIEKNGLEIQTSSGSGGYYDNPRNQNFHARNRKIMSNGDIYTDTAIHYLGDFAVIETEIEYLNSYYEIKHKNAHTMYFRDTVIAIDGDVDIFKYAPPYLFSITKSKTEIFDVDNNGSASVLYTVK